MALERLCGSFVGIRIPFSPFWTTSGIPPTGVAITGVSHASASRTVTGKPSAKDGRMKIDAFWYSFTRSFCSMGPRYVILCFPFLFSFLMSFSMCWW